MNLSVMTYPGEYTQMYYYIRKLMFKGRQADFDLLVGVCLNFNKLGGMKNVESPADVAGWNVPRIVQVMNTVDFIGVSNYPSIWDPNSFVQLEGAMMSLDRELHVMGMSLYKLTQRRQLILAEYGFGGGTDQSGTIPAKLGKDVGIYSYFGIFGPYRR